MKKEKKIPLIALGVIAVLIVIGLVADIIISRKIESRIEKLLGAESTYEKLDVDVLLRRIRLEKLNFDSPKRKISIQKLELRGIGFYDYVMNDRLHISEVILTNPDVTILKNSSSGKDSASNFNRNITISRLKARNGIFRLKKKDSAKNEVYLRFPDLHLSKIHIDSSSMREKIPFRYKNFGLRSDSIEIESQSRTFCGCQFSKNRRRKNIC